MITVYLTAPLYRGSNEDLRSLIRAKEIIESLGNYRVNSIHELNDGLTDEEIKDHELVFKKRLRIIAESDLMVALDSFDQECLCRAEVNYLRAAGYQVWMLSALLAKHQQPQSA